MLNAHCQQALGVDFEGNPIRIECTRPDTCGPLDAIAAAGFEIALVLTQPDEGTTYAYKVEKHEAAVDWTQPASAIARRIRAFDPFPGATTALGGESIKLWAAQVQPPHANDVTATVSQVPGTVVAVTPTGIAVAVADGIVLLTELQRAGGKRLPAADFLRGFDIQPGRVFGG